MFCAQMPQGYKASVSICQTSTRHRALAGRALADAEKETQKKQGMLPRRGSLARGGLGASDKLQGPELLREGPAPAGPQARLSVACGMQSVTCLLGPDEGQYEMSTERRAGNTLSRGRASWGPQGMLGLCAN